MKKVLKRHWWIILLFLLIAILFPLVLNWVMQKPAIFKYVGDSADWLGFWAAYISAIASFAMVIITWMTLSQNKAQLNEMKRQWEEEHRPRLEIYFAKTPSANSYGIEIVNIGKSSATDIVFSLNKELLDHIHNANAREALQKIGNTQLSILPNDTQYISLYDEGYDPILNYFWKICGEKVSGEDYNFFVKYFEQKTSIHVHGNYNHGLYSIDTEISTRNVKYRHIDLTDIREAILKAGFMITNAFYKAFELGINVKTKEEKGKS